MVDRKIGRYRIRALLGAGGMGKVFLVDDPARARPVALKVLDPLFTEDEVAAARFAREAALLARIDHPNVVRLVDSPGREGRTRFFAMEYVEGRSLKEILAELGALDLATAVGIGLDVLRGLAATHAAGVIHRDLKPGNVIIKKSGKAKIGDFGVGFHFGATRLTSSGQVFGTPAYMSPEQAAGGETDERSDIYSAGSVLFEMIAGRPPFEAEHPLVLMRRIVEDASPSIGSLRPGIPESLSRFIEKSLEKNPGNRFQSAEEAGAALAKVEVRDAGNATEVKIREIVERDTMGVRVQTANPSGNGRLLLLSIVTVAAALLLGAILLLPSLTGRRKSADVPSTATAPVEKTETGKLESTNAADAGEVAPVAPTAAPSPVQVRVVLRSGEVLEGELLKADESKIEMKDVEGNRREFEFDDILRIEHAQREKEE